MLDILETAHGSSLPPSSSPARCSSGSLIKLCITSTPLQEILPPLIFAIASSNRSPALHRRKTRNPVHGKNGAPRESASNYIPINSQAISNNLSPMRTRRIPLTLTRTIMLATKTKRGQMKDGKRAHTMPASLSRLQQMDSQTRRPLRLGSWASLPLSASLCTISLKVPLCTSGGCISA